MVAEPMTRAATNGLELWNLLRCREGARGGLACITTRMQPAQRPGAGRILRKLLFVGYLRPEKGVHD